MNPIITSVITAVTTSILTTIVLIFKERFQMRGQQHRQLAEKKLLELYNKLYVINLKYYSLLSYEHEEVLIDIDENGNERYRNYDVINDYTYWERAINEATEVVRQNIHLLEYEDVRIWHEFEVDVQKDFDTHEEALDDALEKYLCFKRFLKAAKGTYGKLFNEYHNQTRIRTRQRRKMYRKKLKDIKSNPFYSDNQKERLTKSLKRKQEK